MSQIYENDKGERIRWDGQNWVPADVPRETSLSGLGDLAGTMLTGAVAEPIAGWAGILQGLNPMAPEGAAAKAVESTRGMLTRPLTSEGASMLNRGIQAIPEPVREGFGRASEYYGRSSDYMAEKLGPVAGAAMKTLPIAAVELVGLKGARSTLKASREAARSGTRAVNKGIKMAAPSVDDLKTAARGLYKELDDAGVSIKSQRYARLVDDISDAAARQGLDPDITPKAYAAIKRLQEQPAGAVKLGDLDTLRKVAQGAARSIDPADANVGREIIQRIDDFVDNITPQWLETGRATRVGEKYRLARDLWGRARRSEMLQEAFEKARNQASGFENGIRIQLRSILNNKKKSRFFTAEEKDLMRKVVQGTKGQNLAKLIGRLGFSEQGATNLVGGTIGAAGGGIAFGTPGAIAVPVIGTMSRRLAQRLTRKSAEFLDDVIRSGKNGRQIVKAYLKHTPKSQRDPSELAELLVRSDVVLPEASDELVGQALGIVRRFRDATGASAGPAGAALPALQQPREEQPAQ